MVSSSSATAQLTSAASTDAYIDGWDLPLLHYIYSILFSFFPKTEHAESSSVILQTFIFKGANSSDIHHLHRVIQSLLIKQTQDSAQ